jgi:hypothetical protein
LLLGRAGPQLLPPPFALPEGVAPLLARLDQPRDNALGQLPSHVHHEPALRRLTLDQSLAHLVSTATHAFAKADAVHLLAACLGAERE